MLHPFLLSPRNKAWKFQLKKYVREIVRKRIPREPPDVLEHEGTRLSDSDSFDGSREHIPVIQKGPMLSAQRKRLTRGTTGDEIYSSDSGKIKTTNVALNYFWPIANWSNAASAILS